MTVKLNRLKSVPAGMVTWVRSVESAVPELYALIKNLNQQVTHKLPYQDVITAGAFRTSLSFPRISIETEGIVQYDDQGNPLSSWTNDGLDINNATITGGLFKTADSGARFEIQSDGIRQYAADNSVQSSWTTAGLDIKNATFTGGNINGSTVTGGAVNGATVTGGTFQTSSGGNRTVISQSAVSGKPGIAFYADPVAPFAVSADGASINMTAPPAGAGNTGSYIQAQSAGYVVLGTGDTFSKITIGPANAAHGFDFNTSGQTFFQGVAADTNTGTANVQIGSSGRMFRTTSLSKYKLDQQLIPLDYRILNLQPKTWIDRKRREELGESYTTRTAGLVAEDVEELALATDGLYEPLVQREEGTNVLSGVAYDRVTEYLIPVVRDLARRVTELETHGA